VSAAQGKGATLRASAWTIAGFGGSQVIRFIGNLILTRLLFPEVFGLAALVTIFIQGLWMFSDIGTGPAIIQSPHGDDERFLNTCWTIQIVRGVILWLLSCAIAAPVASIYGQPLLAWLIPVSGLNAVLNGLEATSMHTAVRRLQLPKVVIVELVSQVVTILAIIAGAVAWRSAVGTQDPRVVWVVVLGTLLGNVVRLALTHTYLEHIRHRFLVDRHWLRVQLAFGRWITLSTILTFLSNQSDRLLFGKLVPIEVLGVYNIAATLAMMPTQALDALGSRVLLPTYSRHAREEGFDRVFARVRLPLLLGGAAMVSGLVGGGPFLVRVLYDHRYWEAGWIVQFLAVGAWFQIIDSSNGAVLLALGHTRWKAAVGAAKFLGLAALVPLGFHLDGFRGALLGLVASDVLRYATSTVGILRCGLRPQVTDALLTGAVGLVSAAAWFAGHGLVGARERALLPLLAAAGVVGVAWGVAGLWYLSQRRREAAA
jgi:O-antigen/teichoic acid export membrane protein